MQFANGHFMQGASVSPVKFQSVTTLNQLEAYGLYQPLQADKATQAQARNDKRLRRAHELHTDVNRRFDRARIIRAMNYATYIDNVENHDFAGGTPAITIYHGDSLVETDGGFLVPYNSFLTAIDGETQTQARFFLRDGMEIYGDTMTSNLASGNWPIAITIYHGIDIAAAQQILHDYNTYATPVSEKKSATFNSTGPISMAIEKTILDSGIDPIEVNRNGSRPTKKGLCSYDQLMSAFAGYVLNGNGLSGTITATRLKALNIPGSTAVPPSVIPDMSLILSSARSNESVKRAYSMVWQVAGVLLRQGRKPDSLNWSAASFAYEDTKSGGRGGVRTPTKDRLAAIADAF